MMVNSNGEKRRLLEALRGSVVATVQVSLEAMGLCAVPQAAL